MVRVRWPVEHHHAESGCRAPVHFDHPAEIGSVPQAWFEPGAETGAHGSQIRLRATHLAEHFPAVAHNKVEVGIGERADMTGRHLSMVSVAQIVPIKRSYRHSLPKQLR